MTGALHLPSLAAAREPLRQLWASGGAIGSVHTLGALHEGHARVIEMAANENDHVVVTVYPNKAQLAPGTRYRYDLERDVAFAFQHGATHVVSSDDAEMYPPDYVTVLDQGERTSRIDGTVLPYLFRGMVTMCLRWILFVRPHRTYWGMKDIGQLLLVRRAVADLLFETEVREVPCVRFRSGIPISSRLLRLDPSSLREVQQVYQALEAGRALALSGETSADAVRKRVYEVLDELPLSRFRPCYVKLADPHDFAELDDVRLPFILTSAVTNEQIFHFDSLLLRTADDLRHGAPVLWLDDEWPKRPACAE